jgi:hypothetical protein
MSISIYEERIRKINEEINQLQPHCNGTHDCPNGVFCGSINFSACSRISILKSAITQEGRKLSQTKKAQELQEITFNEQINSGDFNETPITDVNVNSGCSECTGTDLETATMGLISEMEKPKTNYALLGLIPLGIIAYLVVRK